jgi:hypothetical protein
MLTGARVEEAVGEDGEFLVGPGGGKDEALAVVELVRVLVVSELAAEAVETATLGYCGVDLLLGVGGAAAGDAGEGGGALPSLEGGVRGGGHGIEGQCE